MTAPARPLPNIVYIHSHDTGRYIQPYGHAVPTPHLQALAEEGVLFRRAFCAAPTCSPSRAALLTGQAPHSSGMLGLAHRGFSLNDYSQHIVHTLRRTGYTSALAGVQHVARDPEMIGYDQVLGKEDAEKLAIAWLESRPPQPFFLSVGFSETHRRGRELGYFNPDGPAGDPRYCLPPAPLPDTPETRQDMADFKVSAARLDKKMGEVFSCLERLGLAENTLIICTTDHGIAFPHMKCNLTDHGLGVFLIMKGPAPFRGGKVIDAMVSHIDIFPTICDYLGLERPTWLQGASILPLLAEGKGKGKEKGKGEGADTQKEIHEEIYAEVTYHAAYEPKRAVRTTRWKYIRNWDERRRPVLPNCDRSLSKEVWLQNGWAGRPIPEEELYDLLFDPQERNNLAAAPEYAAVLADMRRRLTAWMERTNDPLLKGHVPMPEGARVNDPDGIHP
ncbi:MAG TPA: sulfatase [Firmicutes bacterium]|nr:sulfatase [Bacillota bacterium]